MQESWGRGRRIFWGELIWWDAFLVIGWLSVVEGFCFSVPSPIAISSA